MKNKLNFVSYARLSPSYVTFALFMVSKSISRSHVEEIKTLKWKVVMDSKVDALVFQGT